MKFISILFIIIAFFGISSQVLAVYGVKDTINVMIGSMPYNLGYNTQGHKIYCALQGPSNPGVAIIDAGNETIINTLVLTPGEDPGNILWTLGPNRTYVNIINISGVTYAIDGNLDAIVDTIYFGQGKCGVTYNNVNNKIYLTNNTDGVDIHDAYNGNYINWISGYGGNSFYYLNNNKIFSIGYLDTIAEINGVTDVVDSKIYVPGIQMDAPLEANPEAGFLYAAAGMSNYVSAVNVNTHSFATNIQVGSMPRSLAYCPQPLPGKVAVGCQGSDSLYFIQSNNTVTSLFIGDSIGALLYNKKDSLLYCAGLRLRRVILVDPRTEMVVGSIQVGIYGQFTPTYMVADTSGDVYVSSPNNEFIMVLGKLPSRLWRTVNGGFWQDYMNWQYSDDGGLTWGNIMTAYPNSAADSVIYVQPGHVVTIDTMTPNLTLDEVIIDGTLHQIGGSLNILNGPGNDLVVNGVYEISGGDLITDIGGSVIFGSGSQYQHQMNGGTIPRAQWDPNSLIYISGIQDVAPLGMDQSLGRVHWDCSGQTADIYLPDGPNLELSELQVFSTNNRALILTNDLKPELNIYGDLQIWNGSSQLVLGGGGVRKVRVMGNLIMENSPPLSLYYAANPGIDSLFLAGNYSYLIAKGDVTSKGMSGPPHPDSAAVIFTGGNAHQYYNSGGLYSGYVDIIVEPSNVLEVSPGSLVGQGSQGRFWLMPGAVLSTNDTLGAWVSADSGCIRNSGPRVFGPGAGFIFTESSRFIEAGDGLPGDVSMLKIENSYGVRLTVPSGDIHIADSLIFSIGVLETGPHVVYLQEGAQWYHTAGHVAGKLAQHFGTGSLYRDYPIGDSTGNITSVRVELINNSQPGFVVASTTQGPPPYVDSVANCLQRYWNIWCPEIYQISCDQSQVTLSYLPGDFTAQFTESEYETTMAAGEYLSLSSQWSFPNIIQRISGGSGNGGSIILSGGSNFNGYPMFVLGKNLTSIHAIFDSMPPDPPESLQIYGFNPSYWLSGPTASVPVGWINPFDSTGIQRAFFKTYEPPTSNLDVTDSIIMVGGARDTFWLPVDTLNGVMPVYVWLRDGAGIVNYLNHSMVTARRDTVPPAGAAIKPFASDTSYTTNFAISWSPGSDLLSGIQAWRVMSRIDTSAVWEALAPFHNDTSIVFTGALPGHRYFFEAAAIDSAYNEEALAGAAEASVYVAPLLVDTFPPAIIGTEPVLGDSNIALSFPVNIIFNESIKKASLSYSFAPLVITDSLVWYPDSTMVTIFHQLFLPSRRCSVVVSAAQDTVGNPMAGPYIFWFNTIALVSDTPQVVWTLPINGQNDVPLNYPVTIKFSQPMDTSSFRFSCHPTVDGWATSWHDGDSTVVLIHNDFSHSTSYTFSVDSAASKLGLSLDTSAAPNQPWSFNTIGLFAITTNWAGGAWRLFSAPLMPLDTSALAILGDDLGAYSDTTWRLVGYKPNLGYVERPAIYPGYGYWLASAQDANIDAQGTNLYQMQVITLDSGWNVVGNPFDTTVALSGLRVRWNDGIPHELYYSDSLVNSVLRQVMWQYLDNTGDLVNNGNWDSLVPAPISDTLRPWGGYAVYAVRPCSLVAERFFKGKPAQCFPPAQLSWQMELSASMGPWEDKGLKVGISSQALPSYDRLDAEKPPLVSENLAFYLPHHDWGQGPCHRYLRDIRPPGAEQRWQVKVDAGDNLPIEINYSLSGSLETGYRLYLVDRRLGQGQSVTDNGRLTMVRGGDLEIIYTSRGLDEIELRPLEFGLTRIYPNPFRGRTTISYQLEKPGHVSLKVYNSLGQLTATLVDGHREAGFHAALWDGARAAAGVYLLRLESEGRSRVTKTVKLR